MVIFHGDIVAGGGLLHAVNNVADRDHSRDLCNDFPPQLDGTVVTANDLDSGRAGCGPDHRLHDYIAAENNAPASGVVADCHESSSVSPSMEGNLWGTHGQGGMSGGK